MNLFLGLPGLHPFSSREWVTREEGTWCSHTTKATAHLTDRAQRGGGACTRSHSTGAHVWVDLRICLWIPLLPEGHSKFAGVPGKSPLREGGLGALSKASSGRQGWGLGCWGPGCWTILPTSFLPILPCSSHFLHFLSM